MTAEGFNGRVQVIINDRHIVWETQVNFIWFLIVLTYRNRSAMSTRERYENIFQFPLHLLFSFVSGNRKTRNELNKVNI